MPGRSQTLLIAAAAMLVSGCGQAPALSNGEYWREFFGPGQPGENIESAAGGISATAARGRQLDSGIDQNVADMKELYAKANSFVRSFPAAEERYRAATAGLRKVLAPDGKPVKPTDEQRQTFAAAIDRAASLLDAQHSRIVSAQSSFEDLVQPAVQRASALEKTCGADDGKKPDAKCPQFLSALSLFRVRLEIISMGFSHLGEVYEEERRNEDELARGAGLK